MSTKGRKTRRRIYYIAHFEMINLQIMVVWVGREF